MGSGRHDATRPRLLLATVLGLVLFGLLILACACTELTSDSGSTTSTSTTLVEGVTTGTTDTLASESAGGGGDEGEPAGGGASGGGGSDPVPWGAEATDVPDISDDSTFVVVPFSTVTSERCPGWPSYCQFDESNNGETWGMTVGDVFYVGLDFSRSDGVADAVWAVSMPPRLDLSRWEVVKGRFGAAVIDVRAMFETTAPGEASLLIRMLRSDGSTHSIWRLYLDITE